MNTLLWKNSGRVGDGVGVVSVVGVATTAAAVVVVVEEEGRRPG